MFTIVSSKARENTSQSKRWNDKFDLARVKNSSEKASEIDNPSYEKSAYPIKQRGLSLQLERAYKN